MTVPSRTGAPVADPIVAGFVVQWDAASRATLQQYGDRLDWVIVEGAFLGRGKRDEVTVTLDPDLLDDARRHDAAVHLMITNFGASSFDSSLVTAVVGSAAARDRAVTQLAAAVRDQSLQGVVVDFELVPAWAHPQVLAFIAQLRQAIRPYDAVVSAALPVAAEDGYPMAAYGEALDYVIPMLYDEHASLTEAGPVASSAWFAERLDAVLADVPSAKIIAAVGQYGYHWRSDRSQAATVSVGEAMALGRAAAAGPWFDARTRNPYASWRTPEGITHTVWYLDAATLWNQLKVVTGTGAAGVALWRLGGEDATLWRVLDRTGLIGHPNSLRALPNDGVSVIVGDGEVLAVEGHQGTGWRTIVTDAQGFVERQALVRPPGGYLIARGGAAAKQVALTFDDGPDETFTAPILDTLASRKAVASFFVVGRQVQKLPALAQRIVREGHEIGNHSWSHPEFATLSDAAMRMELAATGRVVEAVTGHRPLLFRPPYIGDARPATAERLRPMAVANELGYRVAGLEIDTKDWFESNPQRIIANALSALERKNGRIILLHDAGGDRASTIAAIGPLIDSLRARGYEPTTVAGLLNVVPQAGTPSAPGDEAPQRLLNLAALQLASWAERTLVAIFLVALVLGLLRLVAIGTLAGLQRFVPRFARPRYGRRADDAAYTPMVTVVLPAYNEARVIGRTVRSVLSQTYPRFEVLVVDDGSTDGTAAAALAATADPRVRVITQPNGGKASAINHGMSLAGGEVIVVTDADTLLAADAITHLVRPLADPRVGAVAGNAKVGNRVNLVTRWQSVEYVTSQNLDRRAFVLLNCITVVPGAIGAWRRDAVRDAGGFRTDTLAEDQDLTMTLLRRGHRVALADQAVALTEAPESFDALLKQRFRWSFGTLQCAWKHRGALGRRHAGALGLVGLPNIWLFQLFFPLLAPAADIALLATLARFLGEWPAMGIHTAWAHAAPVMLLYLLFLVVDTVTALIGVALEPGERLSQALLVPLQRIAYRQVLYLALLRAMRAALKGWAPAWGKLERTGRVRAAER
jgi:cellulose synthase/poly-beta-1,6-N-acetylglucosamine synthase-like glycosyltransferase/peptidoglycan/xylan/chitin deacetylase (PgdA/CDA1 family)/spore germination protein YaaH